MQKEKQIKFIKTIFEDLEKQKNKVYADGITYQLDTKRYIGEERYEKEQQFVINDYPVVIGAAGQLENNGDYFLHDDTKVPIIVVKGEKDGKIRAFLNMCRHRGARLLSEPTGQIKRNITCPYHAWSYDTAGCLIAVFHEEGFGDVNADNHSLVELDCWVRLGMIFVVGNPEKKGKYDIDVFLQELYDVTDGFDYGELHPHFFYTQTIDCNWKLTVDAALEGYHFKIAHANTIGPYFIDNLCLDAGNKFHTAVIYPRKEMIKLKDTPPEEWDFRKVGNVLVNIFPYTVILVVEDHIVVVNFLPLSATRTKIESFMLVPKKPTTEKETEYWDFNAKIFWDAIHEDNVINISQQKNFNSYSNKSLTLGSYEKLIIQFEDLVDDAMNGELKY